MSIEAHPHKNEKREISRDGEFKDPKKIMASHMKFAIKIFHVAPSHTQIFTHASAFERNKLFKVEILKENYTFKWHLEPSQISQS